MDSDQRHLKAWICGKIYRILIYLSICHFFFCFNSQHLSAGSDWPKCSRKNPDVVIATPGRLIDHVKNTPTFSLESIEVLILDEAGACIRLRGIPLDFTWGQLTDSCFTGIQIFFIPFTSWSGSKSNGSSHKKSWIEKKYILHTLQP